MINGVDYRLIDDDGLHLMIEDKPVSLDVDTVIICAGQEPPHSFMIRPTVLALCRADRRCI